MKRTDRLETVYPIVAACALLIGAPTDSAALQEAIPADPAVIHESARHNFRVVSVVDGLEYPWSMAWLPTGEMLVVERPGRLRVVRDGVLEPDPIAGFPSVYRSRGQGGFMDVLLHPDFERNQLLYLTYGKPNEDGSEGTTTVVRGRLDGSRVVDVEEIFESNAWDGNNNHFAGRMTFGLDGYLYVAIGDRQAEPNLLANHPAQDLTNHIGTVVRLRDDGSIPDDNPFVGHPNALPEIWSYGHRNMQGMTTDRVTGDIWLNEHGPRGGDELNLILPGRNYGWPVVSLGINYDGTVITEHAGLPWMESPRFAWIPSLGTSGTMVYRGDAFPWWRGNVFVGGMAEAQLARVTLDGHIALSGETLLEGVLGRIRDVREGPDGFIYLAIEGEGLTEIVRLEPMPSDMQPPR